LKPLLNPERASRIIEYHMRVPGSTSLREMMEAIAAKVAERPEGGHTMSSEVERAVEFRALEAQLTLAVDPTAASQARAIAQWHLRDMLNKWKSTAMPQDLAEAIHRAAMIDRLERFEKDPEKFIPSKPVEPPPGMPIGDDDGWD
jgi:hypothetical protein